MSGAQVGMNRHLNASGGFEKVSGKLVYGVAESENAPSDATPLNIERLYDGTHNVTQRVSGIQTIGN